jgi:hypothetical protein
VVVVYIGILFTILIADGCDDDQLNHCVDYRYLLSTEKGGFLIVLRFVDVDSVRRPLFRWAKLGAFL